jgi:hypothetical protein
MEPLGKGAIRCLYRTPAFLFYESSTRLLTHLPPPVEDMGVDHGGFHVFVPKEFFSKGPQEA